MEFISKIFGQLLFFIYDTIAFHNYGFSLILFTIITKLALLPLTIKQMKSTQKMQEIQPELNKLQQRYKNDKERLNQEMMKLYQEKHYNPAGGCLPMLIQFPLLIALYGVIRKPLTNMLGWTTEMIGKVIINITSIKPDFFASKEFPVLADIQAVSDNPAAVADLFNRNAYVEMNIIDGINKFPEVIENGMEAINLTFLKIFNLGIKPTIDLNLIKELPGIYIPALVLVIITVVMTFLSTKMSMARTTQAGNNPQMNQTNKTMMYFGPAMTLMISFQAPLGLTLYWLIGNVAQMVQQYLLDKKYKKDEETANALLEKEKDKKGQNSIGTETDKKLLTKK